ARDIPVGGLVERIRQAARGDAKRGDASTRIVLDLSSPAYRRIFYVPEPFRVIVDAATHPPEKATFAPGTPRNVSRVAIDAGHGENRCPRERHLGRGELPGRLARVGSAPRRNWHALDPFRRALAALDDGLTHRSLRRRERSGREERRLLRTARRRDAECPFRN